MKWTIEPSSPPAEPHFTGRPATWPAGIYQSFSPHIETAIIIVRGAPTSVRAIRLLPSGDFRDVSDSNYEGLWRRISDNPTITSITFGPSTL